VPVHPNEIIAIDKRVESDLGFHGKTSSFRPIKDQKSTRTQRNHRFKKIKKRE
jgi:hypothetical protein